MTSIVVLTYNQLKDCTEPCINSIYKYTDSNDFELIIVDNDSKDGTQEYLKDIETKYTNLKIILNSTNKGYSAGNNDGIKASKGDFVILLNNDTLVSDNWLEKMLTPFFIDSNIGMVGPISNSVGNEQRVNIDGLNHKNYNDKIVQYITDNKDVVTKTQRLGFFCVAIKKELIDKIGLLDEKFGIGMFEDDDYCIRATKENYKLVVTDACFIYHKGSVSFKKLTTETYHKIFQKNKDYFLEKHGVEWSLSDISFAYWDKFNSDLEVYKTNASEASINRISVRFDDFKHLLFQVREVELKKSNISSSVPTSVISKTKFEMRFRNLKNELIFSSIHDKKRYLKRISSRFFGSKQNKLSYEIIIISQIKNLAGSKKIIIFPPTIDYGYMKQRPQHLADEFANKGFFVIYATLNHKTDKVNFFDKINNNLVLLNERLLTYLKHSFIDSDIIYYCLWPNNKAYVKIIPHSYLIYDYMDELELLDLNQSDTLENHSCLLEKADLITVSAQKLYDSVPNKLLQKTLLLRNAVDDDFISKVNGYYKIPNDMRLCKNSYDKVVGYYGALAKWVDFDLIEYSLQRLPNFAFVFIGPVFLVDVNIEHLKNNYDNVFFIKEMEREKLIPYLCCFNVCIIPFIKNSVTESVSPVKIYEYIAAIKPIVATNIAECESADIANIADVVHSREAFVEKIINSKQITEDISREFISYNRWSTRVDNIISFFGLRGEGFDK